MRLFCFGDSGSKTLSSTVLYKKLCSLYTASDYIVYLGDNFYPNGVASVSDPQWSITWLSNLEDIMTKNSLTSFSILGNHDYHQDPISQILYSFQHTSWNMPFFFYDVHLSTNIHVFCVDTCLMAPEYSKNLFRACNIDNSAFFDEYVHKYQEKQWSWLEETINQSDASCKIICGHYPVISNGPHMSSPDLGRLENLMQKFGIDIYISGHDHNCQIHYNHDIMYIVSGAVSSYSCPRPHFHENTVFQNRESGFLYLEFIDETTIHVYHVSTHGDDPHLVYILQNKQTTRI